MNTTPTTPRRPAPALPTRRAALKSTLALLASVASLAALGTSPGTAWAQRFSVEPGTEVLVGEPLRLALTGLAPGADVKLQARRLVREFTGGQRVYGAEARYTADAQGRVDLATQAPVSGSYSGADVRGLFWSMNPSDEAPADLAPDHVRLQALKADGSPLAEVTLHLLPSRPEVVQRKAEPFEGAVFASLPVNGKGDDEDKDKGKRPALILLGGSEGGSLITRDAPVWASRGYAVLALPYYSPGGWGPKGPVPPELPGLPPAFADIPLERLDAARAWLAQQPEVDASRIGVMGTSKGAEFALLAGVRMPWIRAIVAVVPTDVVWEGWGPGVASGQRSGFAYKGQPLAFVPYKDFEQEFAGFATGQAVRIRRPQDAGRAANPDRVPAARIPVETIAAPVMVVGGTDDQIWDSGGMAKSIAETRSRAGRETVALVFEGAGHFIGGNGWGPTTQYNDSPMKSGGSPVLNARAQAEAYAQTQAFLQRVLGPVPN